MRLATLALACATSLTLLSVPFVPEAAIAQEATQPATLTITFEAAAAEGQVLFGLYDEAGWTGGDPVRGGMVDVANGQTSITFEGLPAGRYGVKAFRDTNGNGDMDTNPFGMPTEPFAFSNNAKGSMGPATWAQAAFDVAPGETTHTIAID